MATNFINTFPFTLMLGEAPVPQGQRVEVLSRPGLNGQALRLLGESGGPFELITVNDTATGAEATQLYADLRQLVGQRVSIMWNSVALVPQFDVLDCRAINDTPRIVVGMVGGLNPPSVGLLVCRWVLLTVPV